MVTDRQRYETPGSGAEGCPRSPAAAARGSAFSCTVFLSPDSHRSPRRRPSATCTGSGGRGPSLGLQAANLRDRFPAGQRLLPTGSSRARLPRPSEAVLCGDGPDAAARGKAASTGTPPRAAPQRRPLRAVWAWALDWRREGLSWTSRGPWGHLAVTWMPALNSPVTLPHRDPRGRGVPCCGWWGVAFVLRWSSGSGRLPPLTSQRFRPRSRVARAHTHAHMHTHSGGQGAGFPLFCASDFTERGWDPWPAAS